MKIHLILIGSELLNGKLQDKNALWLSQYAHKKHWNLMEVTMVPDNQESLFKVLDKATLGADIILTSGGLGPTLDDLTKPLLADYFQKPMVENLDARKITESHYQRANRPYQADKFDYHLLPQDFFPLYNPTGFAPGFAYHFSEKKLIASMPGVPSEFQSIITESITPLIQKIAPKESIVKKHVIVKTWHVPESKIFKVMAPNLWGDLANFGSVSSLPHFGGVDIGVEIEGKNESELIQKEQAVFALINQTEVKNHIWHIGPESLEEVIVKTALTKNLTIGFAESCTGGLCASRITDIAGSSSVFLGSIVSYANSVKENALQVKTQTLIDHGAVSLETAHEMAIGARKKLQVDIAIATTGIAGPGGGSEQKPVGTVGIGFATKDDSGSEMLHFLGDRLTLKLRFSQAALFKLLEIIQKY